jgi:Secretion system C-terminal sorting domain
LIIPDFTLDIRYSENCQSEGYFEHRTYTWVATDVCGNSAFISFSVDIIDDLPPLFLEIPADTMIICSDVPEAPEVRAIDSAIPVKIVFEESMYPGEGHGVYIITHKWIATDACGNSSVAVQRITWIPDTYVECGIIAPKTVECNTHGILIQSQVTGGIPPYTYLWEVVGENCFIQGGQNTPEIFVYIGWSEIQIGLTVTDAFGCYSVCGAIMDCVYSPQETFAEAPDTGTQATGENEENVTTVSVPDVEPDAGLSHIRFWPNPAKESVYLSFESEAEHKVQLTLMNFQGQVIHSDQFQAIKGFNTQRIDVKDIGENGVLIKMETAHEVYAKLIILMRDE